MGTNSIVDETPTAPASGCREQLYNQETDAGNARRSGADWKPYATPRLPATLPSVERAAPPPQAPDASNRAMPIRCMGWPPGPADCRARISGDSGVWAILERRTYRPHLRQRRTRRTVGIGSGAFESWPAAGQTHTAQAARA